MASKQPSQRESAFAPKPVGQDENRHYGQSNLLHAQGQADAKPKSSQTSKDGLDRSSSCLSDQRQSSAASIKQLANGS